ncbi:MAG TPA: hypothetical protein DHV29_02795 [Bacteroidales bacterium]|nr:hypothetical protein [Bacteroidales bacterium]HCB62169.1 hypothetical protein [Bacteroidales bacterium]HCY22397.1 hypothetical protein [Bacteroidales bacterium]
MNAKNSYFCCVMKADKSNLVIIGAGNVGTHLAKLFSNQGVSVTVACRENSIVSQRFDNNIHVVPMHEIPMNADLYLLTLKDAVIAEVASMLPDLSGIVAHTSGSVGLEPLSKFQRCGVFYPFQSFRKEIPLTVIDFPILIEASDAAVEQELLSIASLISSTAMIASKEVRAGIHTAGVFVSNFTNLMYCAGWSVAEMKQFDAKKLLLPLIQETALRLQYRQPSELQTGPAIRDDRETILKHLDILEKNPELYRQYKELTNALLKKYGHEELS